MPGRPSTRSDPRSLPLQHRHKRSRILQPACPNCGLDIHAPAACQACAAVLCAGCRNAHYWGFVGGQHLCVNNGALCGCGAPYLAGGFPPHANLGVDGRNGQACCTQNGGTCDCGTVYSNALGRPHANLGIDARNNQACCTQNGGTCDCGAAYDNLLGRPHANLGIDARNNQACCTQNGATCDCGTVYSNALGRPHANLGIDARNNQACCTQNGGTCDCGAAYDNLLGRPHANLGIDARNNQACCTQNGGTCDCGAVYDNLLGRPHANLGIDARNNQACCTQNGGTCDCGVIYSNALGRPHGNLGTDARNNQACCTQNGGTCDCGVIYSNALGRPHANLGVDARNNQACCTQNGATCDCGVIYSNALGRPHAHLGIDTRSGDLCCAQNGATCECGAAYRTSAGKPHLSVGLEEGTGYPCCDSIAAVCPVCQKLHRHALHQRAIDVGNHRVCTSTAAVCPHCNDAVCHAKCQGSHAKTSSGCCNAVLCVRSVCARCNKCAKHSSALTLDLCATCRAVYKESVDEIRVGLQRLPGSANKTARTAWVVGLIKVKKVGSRKTPPPAISCLADAKDDIAEMKQFDRGHLIALELDGQDDKRVIAPMNYRFNRSGKWRTMETTIVGFLEAEDATNVDGLPVFANPTVKLTTTVTLSKMSTFNKDWVMEVKLLYDDQNGDPRVPIWFYVRVFCNKRMIAHFSLANRCDKTATMPHEDEVAEFEYAKTLFQTIEKAHLQTLLVSAQYGKKQSPKLFDALKAADLSSITEASTYNDGTKLVNFKKIDGEICQELNSHLNRYVVKTPLPATPPNQLLQFMFDVNEAWLAEGGPLEERPFLTMDQDPQKKSTAYSSASSASTSAPSTAGRTTASFSPTPPPTTPTLAKRPISGEPSPSAGGRQAPEVDHIDPSYQSGKNSYINGRLVSFQHNHLYREKKTTGAIAVSERLLQDLRGERLCFINAKTRRAVYCPRAMPSTASTPI